MFFLPLTFFECLHYPVDILELPKAVSLRLRNDEENITIAEGFRTLYMLLLSQQLSSQGNLEL